MSSLWNFYPRSPCGERPVWRLYKYAKCSISIHALLAESDFSSIFKHAFNIIISIHALLAESDFASLAQSSRLRIFLSTLSLRRATCALTGANRLALHFYPRSPCGERPCNDNGPFAGLIISIHALLAESDPVSLLLFAV